MSWVLFTTAIALGLLAGSFLNVVIYRGPTMWGLSASDCRARGTLVAPRSRCPSCGTQIAIADLVPVASYFLLRGKCRACRARIPVRYPIVELAGGAAAAISLAAFGLGWSALFAALFLLALIALAAIDLETGYLPDAITLPLLALGLAVNATGKFAPFANALIGAVVGYIVFAAVGWIYLLIRRREGLGGGDAKLLAAIGAWSGWTMLAPVVFAASLGALIALGMGSLAGRRFSAETPIPFGPALCAGAALMFLSAGFGVIPGRP